MSHCVTLCHIVSHCVTCHIVSLWCLEQAAAKYKIGDGGHMDNSGLLPILQRKAMLFSWCSFGKQYSSDLC